MAYLRISVIKMFSCTLSIIAILLAANAFSQSFTGKPQYQIEVRRADTLMGKIVVEMFPAIAPNHVRNWDSLVTIRFYDSTAFHRVIPDFMIQGGDPNSRSGDIDTWGYGEPGQQTVDAEFSAVSHRRGILSAARASDPNSATSQFFICVGNPTYLDRNYTVYGQAVSGMDVVDEIVMSETDGNDHPVDKISMFVTRLGSNDSLTATPQLVDPPNGMGTERPIVDLYWDTVTDAMLYRIQVATDESFGTIIEDTSVNRTKTTVRIRNLAPQTTYYWHVMANNGGRPSGFSETRWFRVIPVGVADGIPSSFKLDDVYPNPIRDEATIRFHLGEPSFVIVTIFDMLGRTMLIPVDSKQIQSGMHEVTIGPGELPPGMYFYRLEAGGRSITKRMIVE